MRNFFLTISLIVIGLSTIAQTISLSTELTKDSLLVGEPTDLKLTVISDIELDRGSFNWQIPPDSLASGLEILEVKSDNQKDKGKYIYSKLISFSSEETGYFPVEPLKVNINEQQFKSEAKLVTVFSTLKNPEQEELRNIKESDEITYGFLDFIFDFWFIFALVMLVVLALLGTYIYFSKRKRKEKEEIIPEVIPPAPIEVATEKLEQLKASKLWQTGELKEYHSSISYILREYLEGELKISALENTTNEIMRSLQKFGFHKDLSFSIKSSLSLTDLVKFAKQKPTENENRQVLADAEQVVNEIFKLQNPESEN